MDGTAFLFDLDGVVFDTEGQYSEFWREMGVKYFSDSDVGAGIKGQTLRQIFDVYFPGNTIVQEDIRKALNDFESRMEYPYVPGVERFLEELRTGGIRPP